MANNVELGYAEITSDATTTSSTPADVGGLSITIQVGSRPIRLIFDCQQISNSTAGDLAIVYIREGSTTLALASFQSPSANYPAPCHRERRLAPTPGSHTYKVSLSRLAAGTAKISAQTVSPAFLQAIEV